MPQGCHEKRQDLVLDNIPLLSFMKRCGENFREILGGRKDPRQVMFPGGNPDAVESIYQDTPQSRYYNGIMARSLKALADALPMDRALSILEIGAGTGGTTSALLPVLPAGRTRYVYTDVSPLFTARARDRFAAFPFVEYATLDISRDPFLQGFHADEFDIVVCANVLHATADLTAALRHISAVLAADGLLLLREITLPRPAMGFEISFGCLLDKLRDGELRGDNPFLTAEGWTRLLDTEGFDRTACYPAPADGDLDEHVIIARNGNGSRQAFSTGIAPARTDAPDGDDTGHILLGRRLSSPLAVSQYTAAVSGTLQPFLAQHRVFDIVVVPGTAHFDLAAAAGMDHFGTDRIRLENVVLREALMLDEGERTVQVLVSPTENGADFEIFSRGAGQGQGEWHQHVSGQLAPAHERSAENVDLDRLREGCDEVDVQAFYEKFDAYGAVQYGPAFRSLRRLWRTRGGAVAEVALDSAERGKKGGFIIHPALLDSCLQSMVAALAATEDDLTGDGFMPFSVEKVIFHGRAPETVWCRAVMKEGDSFRQEMFSASFTIFTPEGEPVCEIVNLTMRRTNKETLELLKAGQRQHTDLCYDVVWRQALMPEAGDAAGHWLILAGRDTDFARALARSLEQQGATAMLAACAGTGHPDDMAAVDPGDADAFARLIRDWRQGGTPRGVVFLWGLDCYETDFLGSGGEAPFKNHTAQAFLHLAQALAAQEDGPSVRLAVLTCQAQAARASDQPVPAQSLLWGLEKSVANELGNIAPVIIDMDPVAAPEAQLPTLCGLLTARGYKEDKLALRGGSLLAPRLVRGLPAARQVRNAPLARPETQAYHLDLGGAGIENIRVAPLQRRLPGPGEIEIAAEAYGMNFQNVMVAMGVADKIRTLVLDCAGTVSAVGEGVTRFSPGDRVFTTVYGPFASHVYAREAFAASIPEGMPFTDAAVIPTVFMTAWQALVHAARLQPGERVLLHSATGGVGLAAIQIARARGAVILATAGTERKRALLRSMGIEHVFSSRSTAFESRVLKATGGQGVHVVLNFLTGELADSSMRCLTEGGRFIEIGKTDLRTPAQVAAIRDDIEYHIVDLEKLGKEDEAQMRGIFAAVMEGFAAGHYTPIARRVFTMDAARDAFRYMLEGRHIGKVVVRNDFAPRHEGIRRETAYLVTGGLSDLGLALAAHLAARGAGQVWLLGRRLPEAGSAGAAAVEKIAATGCDVRLLQVDVTDRAALAEAFGTHLLPSPMPLAGVFHLAGLLDDAPLSRLDWARFNTVLSPKVDGSWFLHELTRDLALDHFVVFSSIASVFGTHGQANHVAANTFMDALVAARRADFLPGLSINWGAWGELGTVVRLGILDRIRQQGVEGFDTATGLAVLDRLMASGEGSKVVTRMDWNRMLPILQATAGAAMYEELRHSPAAAAARPAETAGNSRLAAELRALPMSGREERLRAYLKKEIAGFLRLEEDAIPEDVNLTSLGMDSLISLDLFQRISRDLKIRIAPHEVSATPTVQAMAARFARDLGPASGEEETAPAVQSGTPVTKEEGAGLSALLVPAPEEAFEPFPLSDMQQAYWIGRDQSGLALGGVSCHFYFEAQAQGLDADRYEEAWNRLILRQPMLRTIILDGERQQVLEKVPHYTIRRHDLRQSSPEEAAVHFERIRMEMSHEVLDVGRWPNFRVEVSLLPDDALRIHLSFDLILSDFHGISQMLAELSLIYNGQEDKLPVLDITFRDYRLAEERYRATGIYARDRDYWLARLDDLPAAPRLPLATSPAAIDRPVFSRRMTTLDKETWQRIKQRGDARGLAPTAVALATFAEVLGCWSEEKRFCINLTLFNRLPLHRQVNALVGEFTSNSLLAVDLTQGGSFETRAGRLWSRLWDDMEHRSFSGIRVLRELGRRRGTAAGIMPVIFTSALSMESSSGTFALGQMGHEVYSISQTPQVWLDHQLFEVDGELRIVFDYVRDLFPDGMIDAMFEAYAEALRRLSRDDAAWGDAVPVRLPASQLAVRAAVNDTALDMPGEPMFAPFLRMAGSRPDATAVISADRTLSYGETERLSRSLARELDAAGVRHGDRVAVLLPRGWEQVVAVLGIQRAGAAYLPLDTGQPDARIATILADAGVRVVVGRSDAAPLPEGIRLVAADLLAEAGEDELPPQVDIAPDDLAYIIYTSGSTGTPKGVMISHRAAMNTILDVNRRYGVDAGDRILALARLSFDLSVYDIFGLLAAGGAVVIPDEEESLQPQAWVRLLHEHRVSLWNSVPALGQLLADAAAEGEGQPLPLRLAIFSGDWIPQSLPPRLKQLVPGIRVMAMGGATEASIWSNFHETGPDDARWASVPYGRPLANQAFAVLDDRLQPRPDWVAGDLYISGDGLALGYWNDPEKTAGAFLPAGDGHPRLYRTGDTARYHDDGTLEFLGRKDEQVKIHGYRVEPGEIESVLKAHPAVNNAAVLLHKGAVGELSLAAYVEADPGHRGEIVREERAASRLEDGLPLRTDGREGLDEERFLPVWDKMKELYAAAVTAALEELGFFGHGYRDTETFLHDSGISPRYGRWLARAVKALHDLGLADRDGDGVWQRRGTAPDREVCLAFCADRAGELGYSPQEMALLARTVRELPAILREDVHSAEFYTSAEVPGFYQKIFGASNQLTADLVTGLAAASGNGFRILEVGGGYGTVTRFVLPGLPDGGVTYDFTDISPFFLNRAREEFAGYPFVNYRLLDLDEDPRLMGFEPHGYDLILAGNVLHDAADIRRSLKYLTGLLKPSGILLMQEETVFQLPFDLSMGLQQGFDSARDEEFRPEQPLLTRELWTKALTEAGLSRPSFLMPPASLESRLGLEVILSEGPSSVARFTPRPLEDHLRGHLPAWMIPVSWTLLDRMPLTRNGKVDRKRLSGGAVRQRPRTGVTARTRTEQAVAAIWKNVLRVDDVGVTDSFFLSGGDSLSAFQLLRQLEREFSCRLTLRDLLQAPTVAAQAALVDHRAPGASAGELVCLHDADGPATVCMMHPVEGLVNAYAPLAAKLGEVSFHALQSAGLDGGPLRTAFPDMVTAALEAVEGLPRPLLLGGWSMGAFLAWETARRLLAGGQGEHLLPLVLLDPPSKPAWDSLYDSRAHDPAALLGLVAPAPQKALAALGMSEGDLAALDAPARARVLAEALRSSGQLAVEKDDLEMAGRVMEIIDANLRALRSYAPQPLEGLPVLYVRSNSMEEDDARTAYWRGLAGSGFEELAVDADHWNLLHDPGSVDAIAARLARLLKKHA